MKCKNRFNNFKVNLIYVFLIVFAIIQMYPLIWLVLFSFKSNKEIFSGNIMGLPEKLIWSNYYKAIINGKIGIYFLNSTIITFFTIVISGIFSATSAYAIARMKWNHSKMIFKIFLLGITVPVHSMLLPLFIILKELNLLNTHLALIIPYVAFQLPISIFVLTGFIETIPRDLEEAACLDGCNIYQIFLKIIFPLIRPALATVSIFTFLFVWNELMFANTFINDTNLKTITVGIMSMSGQHLTDWGAIGAGLVIATIPAIVVYVMLSDQIQTSIISGSIKG